MKPILPALLLGLSLARAEAQQPDPKLIPYGGWMTADSLARAVGLADSTLLDEIAQHLSAVHQAMTRAKNDPAQRELYQETVDAHLSAIRGLLPEEGRPAFDRLPKPRAAQFTLLERQGRLMMP